MSGYHLGYGTNGFANHRLDDALAIIADLGYTAVALTLDHQHLDPYAHDLAACVDRLAARLDTLGLRCVVETGARFLLDPWHKHEPTLVSEDADKRLDFLARAIRVAGGLGADCVSFWSGVSTVDHDTAWRRLRERMPAVLAEADRRGVRLGLEPEPGMLVETLSDALRLRTELGEPEPLGITLDVGHCVAVEEVDAATCLRRAGGLLVNVQLDDMRPGVHEHLEFGDGELDLPATLAALDEIGYRGVAAVELPRHGHAAPQVARTALTALRAARLDQSWLGPAQRRVAADPGAIRTLFPAAGRHAGRAPLHPHSDPDGLVHGTADDLARTRLLETLATVLPAAEFATELADLYRYGDGAERRGVLRALSAVGDRAPATGLALVRDALRSNDTGLIAAALGPFAARHLDQHGWRHGVLKCLFTGIPVAAVAELDRRADDELRRMITDYAGERRAAGRAVPADALRLLEGAR
ncbi:EboA domain-containing protein [Amycolatopsis granulosa]|uniref:EboA domain-containing protein n=1 Tax=Amycolatopsis granulosa TaxID=185684 RepID=UPI001420ADED|nr:EboA domain-containing protein [Amycolatopsis granulosa]NIH83151.1 sugar phosphate isomerase/epimerase [Amycolatopsis granulosa]